MFHLTLSVQHLVVSLCSSFAYAVITGGTTFAIKFSQAVVRNSGAHLGGNKSKNNRKRRLDSVWRIRSSGQANESQRCRNSPAVGLACRLFVGVVSFTLDCRLERPTSHNHRGGPPPPACHKGKTRKASTWSTRQSAACSLTSARLRVIFPSAGGHYVSRLYETKEALRLVGPSQRWTNESNRAGPAGRGR